MELGRVQATLFEFGAELAKRHGIGNLEYRLGDLEDAPDVAAVEVAGQAELGVVGDGERCFSGWLGSGCDAPRAIDDDTLPNFFGTSAAAPHAAAIAWQALCVGVLRHEDPKLTTATYGHPGAGPHAAWPGHQCPGYAGNEKPGEPGSKYTGIP